MTTKADRGTKRTCQDASCAVRFYDLAREPIKCPSCGALYQIVVSPPDEAAFVIDGHNMNVGPQGQSHARQAAPWKLVRPLP